MPFVLNDLAIHQGSPPPNIIQLWEFLLAGWARLINTDPIFVFWRARFVIPFLGLSGMYLLVKNVCRLGSREQGVENGERTKAEIVFWAVLIMCSGWFIILSPSNFDWVKADPFRGLFMFMGTVHHADAAMDLLIALSAGIVFMVFNNFSWRNILLLAGILAVCFMWHVREFFQIALYGGLLSISLLIFPAENKKEILKKAGIILGVFLFVAVLFYLFMSFSTGTHSQAYNEVDIKKTALKYAFLPENITGIRSLFNFPYNLFLSYHFAPDKILSQEDIHSIFKGNSGANPQFFLWLILSAGSIPFLVKFGDTGDRQFSLFYILLWFSSLLWNFSMLMLIVFTYSEFHMGTPRVIYIFSYIVIAAGLYNVLRWFFIPGEIKKKSKKKEKSKENKQNIFIPLIILHCAGWIIKLWWSFGISGIYFFSFLLSIGFIICFCFLVIPYFYNLLQKENKEGKENIHSICVYILGIFLFFLPLLGSDYYIFCGKILQNNPDIEWFGDNNILGFSQKLMNYMETVPSKQTFLVHPISGPPIPVYYSQYLAVIPSKMEANVINDQVFYDEFQKGGNPLFPVSISADTVLNHEIVKIWLIKNKVNYILIQRDYYNLLLKYFSSYPDNYEIMFNNIDSGEMVVKIRNL
jgi:hypothetical protein